MSSLAATYLVYAALALPVVAVSVWGVHRWSGPLLLDALDADEMLAAAVLRLVSLGYALLALGVAVGLRPDAHDLHTGAASAVASCWGALLILLGLLHVGTLAVFARVRAVRKNRDLGPARRYAPPAGPPAPLFGAPPPFLPPGRGAEPVPAPRRAFSPAPLAPPAPPWCWPPPGSFDPWVRPPR